MKQHFDMFAHYNAWANGRLYDAAAKLSPGQLNEDRGAFFKSVLGTLNHILVGDRIWMQRFTGEGPTYPALNVIVHDDFADLREAREHEDERICGYVAGLSAADLAGSIAYRTITRPSQQTQALAPALAHFFNHQTHHRGQAHGLLTAITGVAPELDLLYFQRVTAKK